MTKRKPVAQKPAQKQEPMTFDGFAALLSRLENELGSLASALVALDTNGRDAREATALCMEVNTVLFGARNGAVGLALCILMARVVLTLGETMKEIDSEHKRNVQ